MQKNGNNVNSVIKVNPRNIYVSILAGGQGTRLWPISTPQYPKPFVALGPAGTLYDGTLTRAWALNPGFVVTIGAGQLRTFCDRGGADFLEEPAGRNTAAAVALAGAHAWSKVGEEGLLLILPADHYIPDAADFTRTVLCLARTCVEQSALGVMGIRPSGPETAYGYIEAGEPASEGFRVRRFIEKPDRQKAEALLAKGNMSWNSGMFLYPLSILRQELASHCPGYWEASQTWLESGDPEPYLALASISVDYALMEKTSKVVMVPADFVWSDVGTFPSLYALLPKDEEGNAGWGPGRVEECRGCLIVTRRRETLVRGLTSQVVIETESGLLMVSLSKSDGIRSAVEAILSGA
jgi:mannose-1-phosphate guanylyltransferase / mannose-6-phosphate isomerase